MQETNLKIGVFGENIACKYLKKNGYKIIAKNFKVKNFGEIDIIAKDKQDGAIVFFEVKTLKKSDFLKPEDNFSKFKFKKMARIINIYLASHQNISYWRADLLSITLCKNKKVATIKHFKNVNFY